MKNLISLILILFVNFTTQAQSARVIGYLPTYHFSTYENIDFCKLTHLNLAFANPNAGGDLIMSNYSAVVTKAKQDNPNLIVSVSLAGAVLTADQAQIWSDLIDIPENRPAFIAQIVAYAVAHDLDGIDIDLEWDHVTSGYSDFVTELDAALTPLGKLMTVALPNQTLFPEITQEAIDAFDFVNIMSYDAVGPWTAESPGQHSSIEFAQNGINFWKNTGNVSGANLTLGVPFYGYDFVNSSTVNAVTYGEIVADNPANANIDQVGTLFYNGRPTIRSKVTLASEQTGGIMIWELGHDSFDDYSLLTTIHHKFIEMNVTTTGLCLELPTLATKGHEPLGIQIFPNPATNKISISLRKQPRAILLYNSTGQVVRCINTFNNMEISMNVADLPKGLYFMTIIGQNQKVITRKVALE